MILLFLISTESKQLDYLMPLDSLVYEPIISENKLTTRSMAISLSAAGYTCLGLEEDYIGCFATNGSVAVDCAPTPDVIVWYRKNCDPCRDLEANFSSCDGTNFGTEGCNPTPAEINWYMLHCETCQGLREKYPGCNVTSFSTTVDCQPLQAEIDGYNQFCNSSYNCQDLEEEYNACFGTDGAAAVDCAPTPDVIVWYGQNCNPCRDLEEKYPLCDGTNFNTDACNPSLAERHWYLIHCETCEGLRAKYPGCNDSLSNVGTVDCLPLQAEIDGYNQYCTNFTVDMPPTV